MNQRDLFLTALEIDDPARRRLYLDSACGGDQALRSRVEELLASHADAGSFMDQPAVAQLERQAEASSGTTGEPDDTIAEPRPPADESFAFLAPSDRPGGLGRLAHYEILELVGKGAMGIVFKALDTELQRVVAVKVLAPELATNPIARQRFVREAHAAAAVAHENVVTIHAVQSKQVPPYLVMQFVAGISLHDKLAISGPLTVLEIARIACQAAAGLAAAHKQGLVHRDIKPANILLENGVERVKITDFGLARASDDIQMTQTGLIAGTPQYMSPEQAQGEPLDGRSDLFSLGSVLYTMCTGRPAFRAESTVATLRRVCDDTPRPIREVNPEIPEWLCEIVERLMAKSPEERIQSAREMADLLSEHLAELQRPTGRRIEAPRPAPKPRPGPKMAPLMVPQGIRWPLIAATAIFGLLALVILVIGEATGMTQLFSGSEALYVESGPPAPTVPPVNDVSGSEPGWVQLFNGQDLKGWTADAGQNNWRVEKGLLVGSGSGASLVSENGLYSNFQLRARVRVDATGDSGLYLRVRPDSTLPRGVRTGYEAQIISPQMGPTDGHRTGSLYKFVDGQTRDVKMIVENHMQAGKWFDYEATADGDRITLKVDGTTVAEYVDPDPFLIGHVALDLFGNRGTVEFEKIEIKELAADSSLKLVKRFDPQVDKPMPNGWADAATAVKAEDGAWRVENDTNAGNFWVLMPTLLEDIPQQGLIVCRAKVKLETKDPKTAGSLRLGDWGPDHYGYEWPVELYSYRGSIDEWKAMEVRYPARAFHEKTPPQISVRFGLHSNGVLRIKDVELLHSPEEPKLTAVTPSSPSAADQELLEIAREARDTAKALFEAGKISQDELLLAEVGYAEVQLKLPTITFQEEERLLRSIIANYKLIVAVQRQRVEAGVASPSSLLAAQKSLAEYERRLALTTPQE